MSLDADAAYQVFKARDARFDGRLFVGVTSTRIYCRPVCRVRTPRRENCRFFETPAQAEAAAFRPCMKCRPEAAPGRGLPWTVMDASRTLALQAAAWLDRHVADDDAPSMALLAAHLGVSDRHLRRIFMAEHGVAPLQYLQTRRLLTAKQLLTDTGLPVAQVALASGFRSLRRFNAAFAQSYRMNPSRLRAEARGASVTGDEGVTVRLGFRPPYDVASMLRFVSLRAVPGAEAVEGSTIRRSLRAGEPTPCAGWLEASFQPAVGAQAPHVRLRFAQSLAPHSARVVAAVRRWLDLDAATDTVDAALSDLPGAAGLRLPGSMDAFEMAVRAVLGQQVTVSGARTLARRFTDRFGDRVNTPWADVTLTFPSPRLIAATAAESIAGLGILKSRAAAIVALAQAWPQLSAQIESTLEPEALVDALCGLPGIGPWTAHYIAMRALGWPDAFPPADVAVLKAVKALFAATGHRDAEALAQRWRPWRAYAVLRLWNTLD